MLLLMIVGETFTPRFEQASPWQVRETSRGRAISEHPQTDFNVVARPSSRLRVVSFVVRRSPAAKASN